MRMMNQIGMTITAPSRKYRHSQRIASKPIFQIDRISRSTLWMMSNGSRPSAERITPTRIDTRIKRTSTPIGEPPTQRATCFSDIPPSIRSHCSMLALRQHAFECLQPIGFARRLVPAQATDARKAHCDTGLVARRALQPLERNFQHQPRLRLVHDLAHGAESIDGIATYETVDLDQLLVGKSEISLADGNEFFAALPFAPNAERVVGIIGRALAMTALRIHQHGIDYHGIALPFPPRSLGPT